MSIKRQVGNDTIEIPEVGENRWGEKTTFALEALVDVLSDLVGPNDIITKEALLSNNTSIRTPINGFRFNTSVVQQCEATGFIIRTFPSELGIEPLKDAFKIVGVSHNGAFDYSVTMTGSDCGVMLFARDDGQFEYTAIDIPNTENIFIKFRGSAISEDSENSE